MRLIHAGKRKISFLQWRDTRYINHTPTPLPLAPVPPSLSPPHTKPAEAGEADDFLLSLPLKVKFLEELVRHQINGCTEEGVGGSLSIALLDLHLPARMIPRDFGKDEHMETKSHAEGCWGRGSGTPCLSVTLFFGPKEASTFRPYA